ncbi:hypothetical protein QEZ54_17460 [Catellatospora sp. KI3]|uniref:hypothetical protein n=1 Tax=Catellatospora sp. KI3 TaxID=3041620 RepID=UPI002482F177|nr:hypothetical protein [Catellatospora sp. KI3]MDI1462766.1 hypothetical protein [Catellatospora sp. KI3]
MTAPDLATARPASARPASVRVLAALLVLTALVTAAVEWLNWYYAEDGGYGLFVRTGWALLRALGFLVLIWHVWAGRPGAAPFGLILGMTTIFSVARLVVPRKGYPPLPGIIGFGVVTVLCLVVIALLYRSAGVAGHLRRPRARWVVDRDGINRKVVQARPQVAGWLLTARVASFSYSALMLVACAVAFGPVLDGRLAQLPLVLVWLLLALVISYVALFAAPFLLKGKGWARLLLVALTIFVLVVHLPLCWWLLGVDGLVRDGGPLVVAALLTLYGLWRSSRNGRTTPASA